MIAAGMPSNVTPVPATVVDSAPLAPTTKGVSVAGPMFAPNIRILSPGETAVGIELAAFWTATIVGVGTGGGAVTVSVTATVSGLLAAGVIVIVPEYVPAA